MGFFSRLLKIIRPEKLARSQECIDFLELKSYMENLLAEKRYISKREYLNQIKQYESVIKHFTVLKNSGMLEAYCGKNVYNRNRRTSEKILRY